MIDTCLLTHDTIFDGRLKCSQYKDGYRFSIDSVLLAHFRKKWSKKQILDMGCGCGILGLILLYRNTQISQCVGLEIQRSMVELARYNISTNSLKNRYKVIHGDYNSIATYFEAEQFTQVICNPPFFRKNSGRPSLNKQEYLARHQQEEGISNLVKSLFYILRNKGEARMIYPADRLSELFCCMVQYKMQPKILRFIYSYPEATQAKLVLIEAVKNGNEGLTVLAPLYIYEQKNGLYSEELIAMYQS